MFWHINPDMKGTHNQAYSKLQKFSERLSDFFASHRNLQLRLVAIKASYPTQRNFLASAGGLDMNTWAGK